MAEPLNLDSDDLVRIMTMAVNDAVNEHVEKELRPIRNMSLGSGFVVSAVATSFLLMFLWNGDAESWTTFVILSAMLFCWILPILYLSRKRTKVIGVSWHKNCPHEGCPEDCDGRRAYGVGGEDSEGA